MKTKIEISGYEIEIELHEDSISIKAEKDGEVVEEMDLPLSEMESEEDEMEEDEMEESEEEDFEEEDFEELPLEDEEMEDEGKLESFQSYLNKSRKKKTNLIKEELEVDSQTVEILASIIGTLTIGGAAVTIDKVMKKLKSGKAGALGKKLADHLEASGKAASTASKSGGSKGKY